MDKKYISVRVFHYNLQFSDVILCIRQQVHGFFLDFVNLLLF